MTMYLPPSDPVIAPSEAGELTHCGHSCESPTFRMHTQSNTRVGAAAGLGDCDWSSSTNVVFVPAKAGFAASAPFLFPCRRIPRSWELQPERAGLDRSASE